MVPLSLVILTAGLVLGVFAMLYGTERRASSTSGVLPHERTSEHDVATEPSPLFNLASIGAYSVGFGLTGYLVARDTAWPVWGQLVVAAVAGAVAMTLQSLLIARWAVPAARADAIDQRFLLQGTLGQVTHDIPVGGAGTIRYALDGREVDLPAREMDHGAIASGSDVVIDRVEDGVAYVELWALVEQRL